MKKDERPLAEQLNSWVQIFGIILAGIWGVYAFVHKEVMAPKSAPVNVSVELALETAGTRVLDPDGEPLRAITMRIVARNPSTRTVDLLPSVFAVYGFDYVDGNAEFDADVARKPVNPYSDEFTERHTSVANITLIAAGNAMADALLRPGEVVSRTIVLHVPDGQYDVLDAMAMFPTTRQGSNLTAVWKFLADDPPGFDKTIHRLDKEGNPGEIVPRDEAERVHELQEAHSRGQLAMAIGAPIATPVTAGSRP